MCVRETENTSRGLNFIHVRKTTRLSPALGGPGDEAGQELHLHVCNQVGMALEVTWDMWAGLWAW